MKDKALLNNENNSYLCIPLYNAGNGKFFAGRRMIISSKKTLPATPETIISPITNLCADMGGNHTTDFRKARDEMRKKLNDPTWLAPDDGMYPEGYTWHHVEDTATMVLVRQDAHNVAEGGGSHLGAVGMLTSEKGQKAF